MGVLPTCQSLLKLWHALARVPSPNDSMNWSTVRRQINAIGSSSVPSPPSSSSRPPPRRIHLLGYRPMRCSSLRR